MNAWLPQASYPCGNFSDTSSVKVRQTKGSLGHAFTVYIRTENLNQTSFYPFVPHEISVLIELVLGHLCYYLTDVPPQPNSPPDSVSGKDREPSVQNAGTMREHRPALKRTLKARNRGHASDLSPTNRISATTSRVLVFHWRLRSQLQLHLLSHHTMSD